MTARNRGQTKDAGALRATIGSEAARLCAEQYGGHLRAVVLAGSLARDEATWRTDGIKWSALGDAEFLLVFSDAAPLPGGRDVQNLAQRIDSHLAGLGIVCPITLSPVRATYLRRLRPAIFAYELRASGQLVWGDATVLSHTPPFPASDIPREDAWRLLCNRLVEQLEVAPEMSDPSTAPTEPALYRTVKLHLDMATSFLVFVGGYEPTYRHRAERLRDLARRESRTERYPFRLEPFARIVSACTEWKIEGGNGPAPEGVAWDGVIERARRLWRWELAQLSGASSDLPDQDLLETWLNHQPAIDRARGWLHVLRKRGWQQSWRHWPRWAHLARRGSPRYLVYSAACRLLFELPRLEAEGGDGTRDDGGWKGLWEDLPVIRPWADHRRARPWQEAASEITWNYREFLVDTRA
ncbi:MAG: hypothetical protein ACREK9_18735 [Candidatus Rokuibacteriota bacterium]